MVTDEESSSRCCRRSLAIELMRSATKRSSRILRRPPVQNGWENGMIEAYLDRAHARG